MPAEALPDLAPPPDGALEDAVGFARLEAGSADAELNVDADADGRNELVDEDDFSRLGAAAAAAGAAVGAALGGGKATLASTAGAGGAALITSLNRSLIFGGMP